MTQMTAGWYTTIYYQMIVFLVGFIVSQLFIAVVCFGFENLEEQLSYPIFSDAGTLCFGLHIYWSALCIDLLRCALICCTVL